MNKLKIVTKADMQDDKIAFTVRQDYLPPSPSIRQKFLDMDYPAHWRRGEKRYLTREFAAEIESKGQELMLAPEDARESIIPKVGTVPPAKTPEQIAASYKDRPLVKVVANVAFTCNGTYREDLGVFGYPCAWERHEIRSIPDTLYKSLNASQLSTDPAELRRWEGIQLKFTAKNKAWQAKQAGAQQRGIAKFDADRTAKVEELTKEKRRQELGI